MEASGRDRLRSEILHAREEREAAIRRWASNLPTEPTGGWSLLVLSTSVPGEEKEPPGLRRAFDLSAARIRASLAASPIPASTGGDALGPIGAWAVAGTPEDVKRACIALESALPLGRLADLDVHRPDGAAVRREEVGAPPRTCLVCDRAAWDCTRAGRHAAEDLRDAVAAILRAAHSSANRPLRRLASALVQGAREELDLTPKPGLVDRRDNGSHPDLSYAAMARSIELLPLYYGRLIALRESARGTDDPLPECIAAGVAAEERMKAAIGTNAHRGYIFLSGLVLLAACDAAASGEDAWISEPARLRDGIAARARAFFAREDRARGSIDPPGRRIRRELGLGGIREETESGLAPVLEDALPAMLRAEREGKGARSASFLAMARLMQRVEDTTAVHRCGFPGLARIRRDGAILERTLAAGEDPDVMLAFRNEEYRRIGLTMGGVADCLALTLALRAACLAGSGEGSAT